MPLRRLWAENATTDFKDLDLERTVAVLPVAAIEQHGPHLPVSVDSTINHGVMTRIISLLPDDLPVTFLPLMPVGKSNEHLAYPGTLSLSAATLIALWTEIGQSVRRTGIRKLVLMNSHGGQVQIMDIVARDLRVSQQMFVVTGGIGAFGMPDGLFPEMERRHGIHGGAIETAIMMHLRPDLVREEKREDFVPRSVAMEQRYKYLRPEGAGIGFGWQTQDLQRAGACGNALDADAARGAALVEHMATHYVEFLREVSDYPLDALVELPVPHASVV